MLLLCCLFSHLGTLSSFVSPLMSRCLASVALPVQVIKDIKEIRYKRNFDLDSLLISVLDKGIFDSRNP